ncbi:nucleotidyltransferase domain-containing protein [Aromatoleum diolicum]|uniref:Nucleotidyltransferase domain-containing protein n=1 Tax=Aromatoleum diolicum TaxID=75796 RepID=A0ABX1Q9V2_9RHOO|nr:nucleotidyltransferase domain-containing protein [Aromatoleum diolicum]NMG73796.1 nucleotidyltransferase domain-containing protein [Aromatoleum diolicum]
MRLSAQQAEAIHHLARELGGPLARVRLFGSRLDDSARGGDLDLLLELPDPVDNPALLSARVAARVSRLMQGRRVDVVLAAPNLKHLAIHDIAIKEGVLL